MRLFCLRRTLLCAGLTCGVLSPIARAQNAAPAPAAVPAQTDSPVPVPEQPETANATTANAAVANAAVANAAVATANAATANVATASVRRVLTADERRQQTENRLRALMANLGIAGAPTQDAIIDYLAQDEMARATLREAEKRLLAGLRRDVPPERMRDLLSDYRSAIGTDQISREVAQRRLDARVGYSLDPKLEATLWLLGVLGAGASKLPAGALLARAPEYAPDIGAPPGAGPVYGPLPLPDFGARGEIVGTVIAKGVEPDGAHWLEIRDDSGASERYAAPWRAETGALDAAVEKQLAETQLSARVRVQWAWQEKRRALQLQAEDAPQNVTKVPTP